MAQSGKSSGKKSKPSYIYSIFGVTFVLFLLGTLGLIVINANKLSEYFRESIELQVVLRDNFKEKEALTLRDSLSNRPYAKSVKYVSKDEAAEQFKKEFGE